MYRYSIPSAILSEIFVQISWYFKELRKKIMDFFMKQGVDHVNLTETSVGLSKDDTKAAARQSLNCIKNKKK